MNPQLIDNINPSVFASTQDPRDPEDREIDHDNEQQRREKTHDKTLADSFPTSDPPSSIPDPGEEDDAGREAA